MLRATQERAVTRILFAETYSRETSCLAWASSVCAYCPDIIINGGDGGLHSQKVLVRTAHDIGKHLSVGTSEEDAICFLSFV